MSAASPISTSFTAHFTSAEAILISAQVAMSIARPKEKPCRTQITAMIRISFGT